CTHLDGTTLRFVPYYEQTNFWAKSESKYSLTAHYQHTLNHRAEKLMRHAHPVRKKSDDIGGKPC
ncbi:MAG: hypothetical protein RMK18_11135, partial [Armatimonadota bacterium]|nr:hypothetical protein [Armatimonadota bacterium]MDW8026401.1 hypothetical protein [Armatimonadota bacterium]